MARDVREALVYAERGEVDGAFIYRTDALIAGKNVTVFFDVPQSLYPRVTYPMALTVEGVRNAEAVSLFRFLRSPDAGAALRRLGFETR